MNDESPYQLKTQKIANQIADMYLERFPRAKSYGITLVAGDCDNELTIYRQLTTETLDIIRKCSVIAREEKCSLEEILSDEGHDDLVDDLRYNDSPYQLDSVVSVDTEKPLKFTGFSIIEMEESGKLRPEKHINVDLTDNEFKWLLTKLLIHHGSYSFNLLLNEKTDLANKINRHLTWASTDLMFENYNPFLIEMTELKDIAESILNPFKDMLDLFSSPDPDIHHFTRTNYFGVKDGDIHSSATSSKTCNICLDFDGTKAVFTHHEFDWDTHTENSAKISIETSVILEHFNLNDHNDIYPFMVEHFNSPDGFKRIQETLHNISC